MPSAWAHINHAAKLIGLALIFALFLCTTVGVGIRSVDFFAREGEAGAKLNTLKVCRVLLGGYMIAETGRWKYHWNERIGPRKANYVFVTRVLFVHAIVWATVEIAANAYGVDLLFTGVGILSIVACALAVRRLYTKFTPRGYGRGLLEKVYTLFREFAVAAYILAVIPAYFASTTIVRIIIASVLHPLVYHAINVYTRIVNMRHETEPHVVITRTISDVQVKAFMALTKRIMLFSVGGTDDILFAILLIAIGDLFNRCFVTSIDRYILKHFAFFQES